MSGSLKLMRVLMTDDDYARKLNELDRLLNDPDVSMNPERIWSLLAEVSRRDFELLTMTSKGTGDVVVAGNNT